MTDNTSADEIQCGFGKNIPELEQIAELHNILKPKIVRGKVSNDYLALIDFITTYTKQRELALLERLEKHTKEQIAASKENMQYHQDETKNERLIKEWLGGVQAMELFILPAIQKEKEQSND